MGWTCRICLEGNSFRYKVCASCGYTRGRNRNWNYRHKNTHAGGAEALLTRRGHGEEVEAELASQAPCPVQQATRDHTTEVENGGVPVTAGAASENGGTHEVQGVVVKVEVEGQ